MAIENISIFYCGVNSRSPPGTDTILIAPSIFFKFGLFSQLVTTLEYDSSPSRWRFLKEVRVVIWLVPCETGAVLAHVLCTPYNHIPFSARTMSH